MSKEIHVTETDGSSDGHRKNSLSETILADGKALFSKQKGSTFANDFASSTDDDFYAPVATYEGAHRYDPKFAWEPSHERALVRKLDWRICSWVCLMFFALQLDRGNIAQALTDNMLDDLKINTNDYNTGQTIFYLCFLFAELPSQLISKKLGPDNWIPIQMISWSLVASLQSLMTGRSSFWACRALLGLIEGGFIPDCILYLSYFYTSAELPIRLSFFWTAYQSTNIISAFLAYGILRMRGIQGRPGWAWLFALEGTITGLIGIVSWFYLPPSPTQSASWFRGRNGWFTVDEEKIMVNRVLRDDPAKGDMHNRQGLSLGMLWRCFSDWAMWPIYLLGLCWLIPSVPITGYLTLNLRAIGFNTFQTNLLTIPAYTIFILQLLFWTWLTERLNERFLLASFSQIYFMVLLIALATLPPSRSPWVTWILSSLLFGYPYFHAVLVAITSRNAGSVRTRTVASALYNMCVQASNIIGSNIYRDNDKPLYYTGNKVLIGIAAFNFCLFVATKIFYVTLNKRREKRWSTMTTQEKEHYLTTTTDKGNKRLDFRFAH